MHVRIFKPAKTAMQSGRGNTRDWSLEFEPGARANPDPLMGWASSPDTRQQVRLRFASEAEAVAWAREHGHSYTVVKDHARKVKPKSYADNFAYSRMEPWTH